MGQIQTWPELVICYVGQIRWIVLTGPNSSQAELVDGNRAEFIYGLGGLNLLIRNW